VGRVRRWWGVVLGCRRRWWVVVGCRCPWWWWWALVSIGGVWWWAIVDIDGGVVVGPCHWLCRRIVVACSCHRLPVIAIHHRRVIAGFCRHCVVSPSSVVVVVMSCHRLLVGQVRWVGTEVLTNGQGRTTNVSLSKINVKDKWDNVVGRKKGGKKKELRKEDNST